MKRNTSVTRRLAIVLGFATVLISDLGAQSPGLREVHPRAEFGGGVSLAFPVGEFGHFVDFGGGLNGFAVINLDREAFLGLRFDASFMLYGTETVQRPLSLTIPEVDVDVTTHNFIVSVGMGPQFTLSNGPVRPYVFGTLGFSYFATETSARGTADYYPFGSSVNFDDFTFALTSGAGLLITVSRGRRQVALDLGMEFIQNGQTRYLREGSLRTAPDGHVTFTPIESETNMLVARFGVSVGVF